MEKSQKMKIASYQFGITGDIKRNTEIIRAAVDGAAGQGIELIIFPECALTGYPPRNMADSKAINIEEAAASLSYIREISERLGISVIIGTIAYDNAYYNRAYIISPGQPLKCYDKRALYGWDEENFTPGKENGIFFIGGYKIGVRICFEVRFPEYFRELYKERTDLDIVMFNDVTDAESPDRYAMIRGHLITRAVENVTPIIAVNNVEPFQSAPTCFIDASGRVLAEATPNEEEMIVIDFLKKDPDFGEKGRKRYSDLLLGI